ncbi:uncharacterized protein mi [Epargyreus clarus]|uniref:uncharacterized protein mi n=1 Tax=Epargyreus clarus TaxID=520877 RepID=UPI003C2DB313
MESFEDSNCPSLSDSFSLYERYMRSFNIVDNFVEENDNLERSEVASSSNCDDDCSNSGGNIDLIDVQATDDKQDEIIEPDCNSIQQPCDNIVDKTSVSLDAELSAKIDSPCTSLAGSLLEQLETSSAAENCLLTGKFDPPDVRVSSDDSKPEGFKPVFITSTMENSNNAVDSVPLFRDVRRSESVFKLPIRELSFNGTLKHVQKLKPIVDPLSALSTANTVLNLDDQSGDSVSEDGAAEEGDQMNNSTSDTSDDKSFDLTRNDKTNSSAGDSRYDDLNSKKDDKQEEGSSRWNEQSFSSLDGSFDSGVRSPDMFSDEEDEPSPEPEPFWNFLKDYEASDKRKVRKIEETLQGILPPPSVTTLKTDVTQMLKKYYCFLPAFSEPKIDPEENSMTPTKKVSFVHIPTESVSSHSHEEVAHMVSRSCTSGETSKCNTNSCSRRDSDQNTSTGDRSIEPKMCTELEATEMMWPDVLKCKYYDVYYNVTNYSEKLEALMQKYRERFVGAETDTSVNIYSGGLQSPSSASKRKAMRLKMAQAKSPGRRLSHLARRRQAFCSAATIGEKAQTSSSRMVLIDKKKLINSSERKSPRTRRTPGKRTPMRKTPGKSTPSKTPKTKSGGSSKKKAMRRLLMDSDTLSLSQPTRETLKRALFVSPENRTVPAASTSVPHQAMRSKRALFGSPVRAAETKSMDGTQSDQFLKRKRDMLDDVPETSRSKIAKSLSFGGDTVSSSQPIAFNRRASEMLSTRNTAELNETHKKKLLWAVSEALRVHGWRMSSPGFREKASALARLTRRLLALPPHAARLAAANLSTSDTMLKLARQYVYAIIQGRTVEECFQDEQIKLSNEGNKISGYISATAYQQIKARQVAPVSMFTSQIKENCTDRSTKPEPRSGTKNILQDKLVNIDSNSNSSSGVSALDKVGVFKSNSMPSFEEAAKMRARRQISFDNLDFPKR